MDGKPLRPRLPPPAPPPGWVDNQERSVKDPFLLKLMKQRQQHGPPPPPPRPPPGPFKLARDLYEEHMIDNDRSISPNSNDVLITGTSAKRAVVKDPFISREPPNRRRALPHRAAAPPPKETVLQTKRFRFRSRIVCASGVQSDPSHPNVLLLTIQTSLAERLVRAVISLVVPTFLRARLAAYFPEWNLPARIVVKKHKTGWDEEFAAEKAAYARLQPLQGIVVPEYYGEVVVDGVPAILLSDIGGACLATPEGALLDAQAELRPKLDAALAALARLGVVQSDVKPDNFHVAGDRVMMVDLEVVNIDLSDEQSTRLTRSIVERIVYFYEQNQLCFLEDGLIVSGDV